MDDRLAMLVKLAARQEDTPPTTLADEADVDADTDNSPAVAAAGMLLA